MIPSSIACGGECSSPPERCVDRPPWVGRGRWPSRTRACSGAARSEASPCLKGDHIRSLACVAFVAIASIFAGRADATDDAVPRGELPPANQAPYLVLRDVALGYHGDADDLTDLTEYRIGWFAPSDPDDPRHGDLWWAANLALAEANAAHSSAANPSLPFRLVPCWSSDVWGSGVSQLARMVYDEQPLALLGSIDSASTHLAEQVVAKANLPLISPIATDKTATLAGVSWMFSCAPADDAVARALVEAILASPEVTGLAPAPIVLFATTDHESRMMSREVMREFSRRGRLPEFRFDLPPGAADAAESLGRLPDRPPGAIVVITDAPDAARIAQAVRARLGAVPIYGSAATARTCFIELAGAAAQGVRYPVLFSAAPGDEIAGAFIARFRAERGHAPDYTAALTYDATRLLIEAIRRAGPNRARIREALVQISPWQGIAGAIEFDGTGQNRRASIPIGSISGGGTVAAVATP